MTATRIRIRHVRPTEAQILKARYDEARQIKNAWEHRLKTAHLAHKDATTYGGDTEATRRNINAVQINLADAAGELQVALDLWMHATSTPERRAS
ncbi:hypothetical protein [Pseudarthrobacter sp. S9]|uniref:hypothetical protein n=1 Tax=Pseudarthrobacter sp. S9 TaxID=3418421 RepID=UPI003D022776